MSLINNTDQLKKICKSIQKNDIIGLDIEFLRHNTFYPILCLIQININGQLFAIDPLDKNLELKPFIKILKNRHIKKVLHSSFQDIWVLFQEFKIIPKGLFDTQIMANFLGLNFNISYANLVKELLQEDISKEYQRSDWQKRPLDENQIIYALNDVRYLPQIYQILEQKLVAENKMKYFLEEMENILKKKNYDVKKQDLYKKFSLENKSPRYNAIVKSLVIWRDKIAKKRNIPRSFILKDFTINDIAKKAPKNTDELHNILIKQNIKNSRLVNEIFQLVKKYHKLKNDQKNKNQSQYLNEEEKILYKEMQNTLVNQAKINNIRPEFIVNQEDLKQIFFKKVKIKKALKGWRYKVIGQHLKNYL